MGIFRQFPYTNFHDLNLDWVLQRIKDLWNGVEAIDDKVDNFIIETEPVIRDAVDKWLDEHPEATTTVEDHSLTEIKFTKELADKTLKDYYTPQMFGAVGDGVTDDTEAFIELSNHTPVVIPKGSYLINDRVVINDVLYDFGEYIEHEPLYEKKLEINFGDLTYGSDIVIDGIDRSYAEGVVYLNGYYYVGVLDFTNGSSYPNSKAVIMKYDKNFNFINSLILNDSGNIHSIHTDGEYIYVDTSIYKHFRINQNLTEQIYVVNDSYTTMIPYNKTWYAVNVDSEGVIINILNEYNGGIIEQHKVYVDPQPFQSFAIIDGILYIPTTQGKIRIIDIATYKLIGLIPWLSAQEIENFFKDADGTVKISGHVYGINGIFNIGSFNGNDYFNMKYIPTDVSEGYPNLVSANSTNSAYQIINGTQSIYPVDNGDLIKMANTTIFISQNDHKIWGLSNGNWTVIGTIGSVRQTVNLTVSNQSFGGAVELMNGCGYFQTTSGGSAKFTQFNNGDIIGNVPELYRPRREVYVMGIGRGAGMSNSDPIFCYISIKPNGDITLYANTNAMRNCQYLTIFGAYPIDNR